MHKIISGRTLFRILSIPISLLAVLLVYLLEIPNPMMVLIIPVVFFSYAEGYAAGALSAAVSVFYALCFFSNPDALFTYSATNVYKVLTILPAVVGIVLLTGRLKSQMYRHLQDSVHMSGNFLKILSSMDVLLLVTEPETDRILFANEKMNRAYQVDFDPVGKPCWQVYHGENGRCGFCRIEQLYANPGASVEWEGYNRRTGRWYRNREFLIKWTDGRLVHLQQGVDITESREIEEALRRKLKQQELMSAMSRSFISDGETGELIYDALKMVGEFLDIDRVMLARFNREENSVTFVSGWYREEAYRLEGSVVLGPVFSALERAYEDENLSCVVCPDVQADPLYRELSKDGIRGFLGAPIFLGGEFWGALSLEMCSQPRSVGDSDRFFAVMTGNIIAGVLERDRSRQEMREAEARTQTMLDATPLACTFFDADCSLIDCNEEASRMYGLSTKEEYLKLFYELSPKLQPDGSPSREKAEAMLRRAFETGCEVFEWMHCFTDGGELPAEVTLVRVKWHDNKYRVAGYCRDLRQMKAHMAAIEKTQRELLVARNRAEDSAKAKASFLANMSHEIRTPINAVIGMLELAKAAREPERIRYCLDKADDAAGHLLGVINDILDMSKIDAGKMELSHTDFPLEKMLQRVSNVTAFRAEQKKQDFVIKVGREVPAAIVSDQQRLAQVITNLLSNAVKFTPEGGKISLHIHGTDEGDGMHTLLFEVIDTGIGISEEGKKNLFKSFQQADNTVSRRFGGTGLGLAISKNIVEMMGGEVGIDSQEGKGSRFYFSLRLAAGKSAAHIRPDRKVDWERISVLAVDDAPEVREYFRDIAASAGLRCVVAKDGAQALSLIKTEGPFQILFVDWRMPHMDGIELTRKVRMLYDDQIVIIMISASEWQEIEEEAKDAGVDRFVGKPLLPSAIVDCLNDCLADRDELRQVQGESKNVDIFRGKSVLLAEDVEINREILIAMLADTGVEIECAVNGAEALEKFRRQPDRFHLILMDIHMPEMDGYEATRAIRALQPVKAQTVPIIAMTANVFKEDIELCMQVGMDDHIGKPVDWNEAVEKLRHHLL